MFIFSVLIRVGDFRERKDFRFTNLRTAQVVRRMWVESPEKFGVSPIVRLSGGRS